MGATTLMGGMRAKGSTWRGADGDRGQRPAAAEDLDFNLNDLSTCKQILRRKQCKRGDGCAQPVFTRGTRPVAVDRPTALPSPLSGEVAIVRKVSEPAKDAVVRYGHLSDSLGFLLRLAQLQSFADFFRAFEGEEVRPGRFQC